MKRIIVYGILLSIIVGFFYWFSLAPDEKGDILEIGKKIKNDPIAIIDEEVIVEEDYHFAQSIQLEKNSIVHVKFEKLEGPDFEAFLTDFEEYDKLKEGKEFKVFPPLSFKNLNGVNKKETLGSGNYVFILDNSDRGAVIPPMNFRDDVLRVKLFISKQRAE